jgi:hypothetical protein
MYFRALEFRKILNSVNTFVWPYLSLHMSTQVTTEEKKSGLILYTFLLNAQQSTSLKRNVLEFTGQLAHGLQHFRF